MNIIKIGGAVLKSKDGFFKMVDILEQHSEKPLIMVISAFSSATRDLEKAAKLAEQAKEKEALSILDSIIKEHKEYAAELLEDKITYDSLELLLDQSSDRIKDYFRGLSITGELTLRTLDAILSFGEFFALHTVYHFLQEKGFNIHCVDSTSIIVSDDNYGNAKPLLRETGKLVKDKLVPLLVEDSIVITQGFVAKSQFGEVTTMGIESSNLTAALLAEILDINEIIFWTDVPGLRSADPKFVKKTKPVSCLSYSNAFNLAVNGLKLFHPDMVNHASSKNIKLIFKSAYEPLSDRTLIAGLVDMENYSLIIERNNLKYATISYGSNEFKHQSEQILSSEFIDKSNFISVNKQADTTELLYFEDRTLEQKLKKYFDKIIILSCSEIIIFDFSQKIIPEISRYLMKNFREILISVNFTSEVLRIMVKPNNIKNLVKLIHKKFILT